MPVQRIVADVGLATLEEVDKYLSLSRVKVEAIVVRVPLPLGWLNWFRWLEVVRGVWVGGGGWRGLLREGRLGALSHHGGPMSVGYP